MKQNRRAFLRDLTTFSAAMMSTPTWKLVAQNKARPNVLFLPVDDLKPLLGCYGNKFIKTPNIDRIARSGTVFYHNYCQYAICGPTRASLLTGLRPDTTKVWDFKSKMRTAHPDVTTLPQHFKNNGYNAIGYGKIFDGRCCDGWGTQDIPSWSEPLISNQDTMGKYFHKENKANKVITENVEVHDYEYADGTNTQQSLEKLKKLAKEDNPFFLAVGYHKPHLPFNAPKKYWDMYDRNEIKTAAYKMRPNNAPFFAYQDSWELRGGYGNVPSDGPLPEDMQLELLHGYYACVSYIDSLIGELLDELENLNLIDNTIICLWGDHGWHLGDHGMWCKHTNYEQATWSPLIISSPDIKTKGKTSYSPTGHIDIYPTICELAGLEPPATQDLEGSSLVPVMKDPKKQVKKLAISQFSRNDGDKPLMGYAYRGKRYRYVQWIQKDFKKGEESGPVYAEELYDYQEDPLEKVNVVDHPEYKQVVDNFKQTISDGWQGLMSDEQSEL